MSQVSTHMSSARKVKASLLGFVPQRKLEHEPMLVVRRADGVLSHRLPSTLIVERAVSQTGKIEPWTTLGETLVLLKPSRVIC
jgi:hypothetical protein